MSDSDPSLDPAMNRALDPVMDPAMDPALDRAGTIRTALVDDSADVTFLVATALELQGSFTVVGTAASARTGLALVAATRPELVVVDLHLGGQDGLWLLERLRALVDRTTVLALVTGMDLTSRLQARIDEVGADVALPKRDLATTLPRMLEQCVRTRRSLLMPTLTGPPSPRV